MKNEQAENGREFSHVITAADLPREGRHFKFDLDEEIRAALARRFGLKSLDGMKAHLHAKPLVDGTIVRVEGEIQANLVQTCIVTLDPVPESVDEDFYAEFSTDDIEEEEIQHNLEEADPREPMEDGTIDLGELVAQQLGLMMEPYPRAKGADIGAMQAGAAEKGREFDVNGGRSNPFSVLAQLKDGKKK
ncbi:YceD family protein [Aestuariispira insulae]|uniref:Uncharacterized protein DUF177 involved in 23S rRNA accumulation n=1 Tax=Aestuariispira insulae TaxID=1461337 RepID=A0A3D9HV79_9PROT|nr:DUF177 domain-containing protein [Aestuariispira insulae]RED53367.1 uncharacterized protein DUF177 involved in 23S rRNA accumulation [Aestuariispira insulae]